jgi:hypothetical protein
MGEAWRRGEGAALLRDHRAHLGPSDGCRGTGACHDKERKHVSTWARRGWGSKNRKRPGRGVQAPQGGGQQYGEAHGIPYQPSPDCRGHGQGRPFLATVRADRNPASHFQAVARTRFRPPGNEDGLLGRAEHLWLNAAVARATTSAHGSLPAQRCHRRVHRRGGPAGRYRGDRVPGRYRCPSKRGGGRRLFPQISGSDEVAIPATDRRQASLPHTQAKQEGEGRQ